jgi:hypothetical protein
MAIASRARNSRELSGARPRYVSRDVVRNVHQIPLEGARLIYFDQYRAAELLEHIASSSSGRAALAKLPVGSSADLSLQRDQRMVLSQLISQAQDLKIDGIIDLHQREDNSRRTLWAHVHPDQAIAIRGAITSAKDVQPSSLRLEVGGTLVRVFVERDHFLHLNQSYLAGCPITALGKVRSVPRVELLAAAIGVMPS